MVMRLTRNRLALLATIVGSLGAVAGAAVASGAFAANRPAVHRHTVRRSARSAPRWPFSIFSHPATVRSHSADVGKVSAPLGAILAGVSHVDGVTDELYAWHRAPQEDCLVDVEGGSETTVACSPSSAAEAEGISWVGTNSAATGTPGGVGVVAMVPDGVPKVEVTGADGSTGTVEVVNNVANDTTQADVKEYRYTMPDGKVVSHKGELHSPQAE
jgi:hypothetical protein